MQEVFNSKYDDAAALTNESYQVTFNTCEWIIYVL